VNLGTKGASGRAFGRSFDLVPLGVAVHRLNEPRFSTR
jgi:hypothetical protein